MTILFLAGWFLTGVASYIYWYTKDFDLVLSIVDLLALVCAGILGPPSFFIAGLSYKQSHRDTSHRKKLIRRRH